MKDAVIVSAAVDLDQVTRDILKEHIALKEDERNADAHERKSSGFRESAARRRIELGRMLIAAKSEIKHGGWLPYLEKLGIPNQTANAWMREAGYVDSNSQHSTDDGNLPFGKSTRVASGVDKRARKQASNSNAIADNGDAEPEALPQSGPAQQDANADTLGADLELEIERMSVRISQKVIDDARSWPVLAREQFAHRLRELARTLEEMK